VAGILLNLLFLIVRPPKTRESAEPDDLKRIEGIGPRVAAVLEGAGIYSFGQLADADVAKLQQTLRAANLKLVDPSTWAAQARLAAVGDWSALQELQEKLDAGRGV